MSSLACLSLIIFMEARGVSIQSHHYVASVAVERARYEGTDVCSSMKKRGAYTWMWDGIHTKVDRKLIKSLEKVAQHELKKPSLPGYLFFNECRRKPYHSRHKVVKSDNLCFYKPIER